LPIAVRSSWLGITPASESVLAFTITMNRIVVLLGLSAIALGRCAGFRAGAPGSSHQAGLPEHVERAGRGIDTTSVPRLGEKRKRKFPSGL
jgi:hypothetical protein